MNAPAPRRLGRLAPLDAALARLVPVLSPVAPRRLPLREAEGRVLAAPLTVPAEIPAVAIAIRDGWAVPAEAVRGAGPDAPVLLAAATRLEAGASLPPKADAVIAPHLVRPARTGFEITAEAAPGEGTLAPGDDLAAGAVLRAAGAVLRPRDVALALAAGIAEASVRAPRVAILLTGDEVLADPARDALGPLVSGAIRGAGGLVAATAVLPDDEHRIAAALRDAEADLVLVTGGTGLGASDRSVAALEAAGTLLAHGIAMRPGTTAAIGHVGPLPVLVLPGRLPDCLGALLLLALPCLRRRAAADEPVPRRCRLARKIASQAGFAEVALLRRRGAEAEPLASGALPLSAMAAADAFAVVPAASEGFDAGTEIAALDI